MKHETRDTGTWLWDCRVWLQENADVLARGAKPTDGFSVLGLWRLCGLVWCVLRIFIQYLTSYGQCELDKPLKNNERKKIRDSKSWTRVLWIDKRIWLNGSDRLLYLKTWRLLRYWAARTGRAWFICLERTIAKMWCFHQKVSLSRKHQCLLYLCFKTRACSIYWIVADLSA